MCIGRHPTRVAVQLGVLEAVDNLDSVVVEWVVTWPGLYHGRQQGVNRRCRCRQNSEGPSSPTDAAAVASAHPQLQQKGVPKRE